MIDATEREQFSSAMRVMWVIWSAMFASLGIYVVVCHVTEGKIKIGDVGGVYATLRNVLMVVGIVEFLLIPYIKKLAFKNAAQGKMGLTGGGAALGRHPVIAKYSSALIIALALSESIAVYGLVLFFLSGDYSTLYLFTAFGAVSMIIHRPKIDELEYLAESMKEENAPGGIRP